MITGIRCFVNCVAVCIVLSCGSSVLAQQNNLDLLMGLGDFDRCSRSQVLDSGGLGVQPTANLSVANGWITAINLQYQDSYVLKLVKSTNFSDDGATFLQPNKSYQYIGITNRSGQLLLSQLYSVVQSNPKVSEETFKPGDAFTFSIDRLVASNIKKNSTTVSLGMFYILAGSATQQHSSIDLDMSAGYVDSASFTLQVPNVVYIRPYVQIATQSATSGATPAILLSGARLWIKRSGAADFVKERDYSVPNRGISSATYGWDPNTLPVRLAAQSFDEISTISQNYIQISELKKLNPNLKLYLYQSGTTCCYTDNEQFWALGPFRVQDVVKNNPSWLWPQTKPQAKYDPSSYSSVDSSSMWGHIIASYANAGGYPDRFWISQITDSTYQSQWADTVIAEAIQLGVDGVWMDDCGELNGGVDRDGVWRYTWEVQQFLHAVIPKLRAAGLATIVNNAEGVLDGSETWCGVASAYFNPSWVPTSSYPASAGYSANTATNTPDVFFREFSFIANNFGYSSDYWWKCLNDAKIVAQWNSVLPSQLQKRIHYDICQQDTSAHPAYDKNGTPGWIPFTLASFLLCNNQYVSFVPTILNPDTSMNCNIDVSITKKLGVPSGDDSSVDGSQYFRMRRYKPGGSGSVGGVVVVNADTVNTKTYTVDFSALDESGNVVPIGTAITLKPNTGRILLDGSNGVSLQLVTPNQGIAPGQVIDISVIYTNTSASNVNNVLVRASVPDKTSYVPGSGEQSGGMYDSAGNTVSWTVPALASGDNGTRTFKVTIN